MQRKRRKRTSAGPTKPGSIEGLGNDVLMLVCSFLSPASHVLSFAPVCKQWNALAHTTASWPALLQLTYNRPRPAKKTKKKRRNKRNKRKQYQESKHDAEVVVVPFTWKRFLTSYKPRNVEQIHLTRFRFQDDDWQALSEAHRARLTRFKLHGMSPGVVGLQWMGELRQLTQLRFDHCRTFLEHPLATSALVANLHQLQSLAIRYSAIDPRNLQNLAASRSLTELDLTGSDFVPDAVPVSAPLWKTLILSNAPEDSKSNKPGPALVGMANQWQRVRFDQMACLTHLDLSFQIIRKFTNLRLPATLTHLNLMAVRLMRIHNQQLDQTLPFLQSLDLQHNLLDSGSLTDGSGLDRHQELKLLNLTHCGVTRWELDEFQNERQRAVVGADPLKIVRERCDCERMVFMYHTDAAELDDFSSSSSSGESSSDSSSSSSSEEESDTEEDEEEEDNPSAAWTDADPSDHDD